MNSRPPQPLAPFSHKTPAHSSSLKAHCSNKKTRAHPQKPQQIRMSSPSTLKNPSN
jgi:hypothetical protein